MKDISGLMHSLNSSLQWNKARMSCFMKMLISLFAVRTVNLQEIALAFSSDSKISSRYRRLQRFFALFELDYVKVARWIFKLCLQDQDKFYIIIDRTNWYIGKKKVNIFMLGVAYEGLAIPLFWQMLDKGGSSNYIEQKALINQFLKTFSKDRIAGLLADREFMNGKLFGWLNKKNIPFYIRIKEQSIVSIRAKKFSTAKKLFKHLNLREHDIFSMAVFVFGQKVFLAGSRSEKGELMIVATNQNPKNAIAIYLRRWEIENLFQGLKGRGFRFEETHITCLERIKKLTAILAIGFVWAHRVGEWLALKKPIILKKFPKQKRPQNTYFRYGLDYIRDVIFHQPMKSKIFRECFSFLIEVKKEPAS